MIIQIKKGSAENQLIEFEKELKNNEIEFKKVVLLDKTYLITSANVNVKEQLLKKFNNLVQDVKEFKTEYQLCLREFKKENTVVDIGNGIIFGANKTVIMAGPCAIESEKQVMTTAEYLKKKHNIKLFRAGAFKPRTSPYAFQGLEEEGLKLLQKVRDTFDMKIITEIKDETHLDAVSQVADIIQIGTKSMYIFNMLARCGEIGKPVLIKRGFMATIKEFLQAVDFVMSNGNGNVILCERGVRTFETQTRFSLDVCAAALLKNISHLPVVLDPSHAVGLAKLVPLVAQSSAALEVDGIMVETHYNPSEAKCDKDQALSLTDFSKMMDKLKRICDAVGREIV